ncbi:MAG TPA: hypothetical protein VIJ85_10445 [Rhizomicrobium sp.]
MTFTLTVFAFAICSGAATAHPGSRPSMDPPRFTNPDNPAPQAPEDRLPSEKGQPANPYAGMSCVQLYVLATEKAQDEAEREEFDKKNCSAL